jgi:hypothetical protein
MRTHSLISLATTLAVALTAAPATSRPLAAQAVTVAGAFGGLSGAADLTSAGTPQWRTGWAAQLDGTYWLRRNVGLRASAGVAQDSLRGATLGGRGRFNKFTYDADLILRYPIQNGSLSPFLIGGAGAIRLHQLGSGPSWTKFAGNFGAGLEYRFSQWGLRAEARDYVYKFDRFGFDKTQHDIAWQGGLTVTF